MRKFLSFFLMIPAFAFAQHAEIKRSFTADDLGACQGILFQNDRYLLYGDSKVGVMRSYQLDQDSLVYDGLEYRFTVQGENTIKHPTGIAIHENLPTFIGNSVKLNKEGTKWKTEIFQIDWKGFMKTKTLDQNVISVIDDDVCIQGARPAYVKFKDKWFVATADYGNKLNEVRLYDPLALAKAKKSSESGVLVRKFSCSPWVQNLHYLEKQDILILIQNQVEGKKWRLTFLDLGKSVEQGKETVIKVVDFDQADELEGFTFTDRKDLGVAVTSSKTHNVSMIQFKD